MTADAGAGLARHVIHERPLGLHGQVVLVERLEEDVRVGRHQEVGAAVRFDRDDAMLHLQAQSRVLRDHGMLLVVFVSVQPAKRRALHGRATCSRMRRYLIEPRSTPSMPR